MDHTVDIGYKLQENEEFEHKIWFESALAVLPADFETENENISDIKLFENILFIMPANEKGCDYDIEKFLESNNIKINVNFHPTSTMAIIKWFGAVLASLCCRV